MGYGITTFTSDGREQIKESVACDLIDKQTITFPKTSECVTRKVINIHRRALVFIRPLKGIVCAENAFTEDVIIILGTSDAKCELYLFAEARSSGEKWGIESRNSKNQIVFHQAMRPLRIRKVVKMNDLVNPFDDGIKQIIREKVVIQDPSRQYAIAMSLSRYIEPYDVRRLGVYTDGCCYRDGNLVIQGLQLARPNEFIVQERRQLYGHPILVADVSGY